MNLSEELTKISEKLNQKFQNDPKQLTKKFTTLYKRKLT